jgi:hypothetical protein
VKPDHRLAKLEAEVAELRHDLKQVTINQARNLGLLGGGVAVLTALGGIAAIGKLWVG